MVPELLSPAGSLEKLKVAVLYGADAVYLGGQQFSLRSAADNFTEKELREGVEFAHQRQCAVYVVLNAFFHDQDYENLPEFLTLLEQLKVDAVIVSDIGTIETIKEHSSLEIHLSTQASCLNSESAQFWKNIGVNRIVLGREVSLAEAKEIKENSGLEIEMFIHGSMCMAYSGNCVISNYTQGRDSNRGGCAHSCRFEYELEFSDNDELRKKKAYFMSSKDLNGLKLLEEYIQAGVDSVKVEGRMKSHHYAGTVSKAYKEALNFYREKGHFLSDQLEEWENELSKVSHREYSEANLMFPAGEETIYDERENEESEYTIACVIMEAPSEPQLETGANQEPFLLVDVRSHFSPGDCLELVPFQGPVVSKEISWIKDFDNELVEKTRPGTLVKIPFFEGAQNYNLIRKKEVQKEQR